MFAVCSLALLVPLLHEDDPKVLDRVAPYQGPAYRRAVSPLENGSQNALGFPASNVTLESWLPLSSLDGAASGNDIWGYVAPSGREYAIIGTSSSTVFVEVTDPGNAQVVSVHPGQNSLWRDIKTYRDYAYSVTEGGGGIQVFDLGQIDSGTVTLANTIFDGGTGQTHNVAIDEISGFLYRTGGGGQGLRIYDLADPANPDYLRSWFQRYVHDAQIVTYTDGPYAGRQIAFICGGLNNGFGDTRLSVLDVTNKFDIVTLSSTAYPDRAYAHQGWLDPGRRFYYLGDELDEDGSLDTTTHIIDISELDRARYIRSFTNGNNAIGHNLFTVDDLIYAANYTSGLRVWDASDPYDPVEIGFFDTWPNNDNDSFNGLWGVYPYLPSGNVIGSDLERGLFVWSIDRPDVQVTLPAGVARRFDVDGESVPVRLVEETAGTATPGSGQVFIDTGSGFVASPLTSLGLGQFTADLPPTGCGQAVKWYVEFAGAGGTRWTDPVGAPSEFHVSVASDILRTLELERMETDPGWTVGTAGDDATSGTWQRVDPRGTAAQPGDDRSPGGVSCWVTGQGSPGGALGQADVDGGRTTLLTDVFDLSATLDPLISYWRWYSNDQGGASGEDVLRVDLSTDGGASWIALEVVGPTGPDTQGGWRYHAVRVTDFATPTATMRVRFVASDLGAESIVEAAIDDFRISELVCRDCNTNGVGDSFDIGSGVSVDFDFNGIPDECDCPIETYCESAPNSRSEAGASISASGRTNIGLEELRLEAFDVPSFASGLFFYGGSRIQAPFGDGFRCVGAGVQGSYRLLPIQQANAFGEVIQALDFPLLGGGPGAISPGESWNFQLWYRDAMGPGGNGFNLTDGLTVTFCP